MKTDIILIAACDRNRGIGNKGKLPWNIPADLRHFKEETKGHIVIMGRKTMESLPKQHLPGRYNIVISGTVSDEGKPFESHKCLWKALERATLIAESLGLKIFVIGGAEVFRIYEEHYTKQIITRVNSEYEVDCYLPEIRGNWIVNKAKTRREVTDFYDIAFEYLEKV